MDFPGVAKKIFARGAKSDEISFCFFRNKLIGKSQISKFLPSDAHVYALAITNRK